MIYFPVKNLNGADKNCIIVYQYTVPWGFYTIHGSYGPSFDVIYESLFKT